MPIYEYECVANGHRFEVIQKFDDPPVVHCTVCGEPVQKLLSFAAIQFKGSGWYINDYARKESAGSESASEKSTSGKSESTSAASESASEKSTSGKSESTSAASADPPKNSGSSSESK